MKKRTILSQTLRVIMVIAGVVELIVAGAALFSGDPSGVEVPAHLALGLVFLHMAFDG